eukprot:824153-Rhodomonas_salina.1
MDAECRRAQAGRHVPQPPRRVNIPRRACTNNLKLSRHNAVHLQHGVYCRDSSRSATSTQLTATHPECLTPDFEEPRPSDLEREDHVPSFQLRRWHAPTVSDSSCHPESVWLLRWLLLVTDSTRIPPSIPPSRLPDSSPPHEAGPTSRIRPRHVPWSLEPQLTCGLATGSRVSVPCMLCPAVRCQWDGGQRLWGQKVFWKQKRACCGRPSRDAE